MKIIVFIVFMIVSHCSWADGNVIIGDSSSGIVILGGGETRPQQTIDDTKQVETEATLAPGQKPSVRKRKYDKPTITNIQGTYLGKPEAVAREVQNSIFSQTALDLKSGCVVPEIDGTYGAAVVDLDDFFVVIPAKPNGVPAHPGEAGKQTIHGIDADNDCVRDDIEHYIFKRFKKADQANIRKYLYEYAIWLDFFLIEGIVESSAKTVWNEQSNAGECLHRILGTTKATEEVKLLFANFHNTYPRSYRYVANLKQIAGWTTRGSNSNICG